MAKITIGTTFRSPLADGNPLWKVKSKRGANTFLCEVVNEKINIDGKEYESDYAGHQDVFAGEKIIALIGWEQTLNRMVRRSEDFYQSLQPGQIIHYCNGGDCWVRLRAERQDGRIVCIAIALVGNWNKYDLPYRQRTGEEVYPYHPTYVRTKKPFSTPASNIYECPDHPYKGDTNPAGLPAVNLNIPPITPDEAIQIALWQQLKKVEEVLHQHGEQDPNKLLNQIREIVNDPQPQ